MDNEQDSGQGQTKVVTKGSVKRCTVNTACKHDKAGWYYYLDNGVPYFLPLHENATRGGTPCCTKCMNEIMRRWRENINGK
jgi:hypothetical protein